MRASFVDAGFTGSLESPSDRYVLFDSRTSPSRRHTHGVGRKRRHDAGASAAVVTRLRCRSAFR